MAMGWGRGRLFLVWCILLLAGGVVAEEQEGEEEVIIGDVKCRVQMPKEEIELFRRTLERRVASVRRCNSTVEFRAVQWGGARGTTCLALAILNHMNPEQDQEWKLQTIEHVPAVWRRLRAVGRPYTSRHHMMRKSSLKLGYLDPKGKTLRTPSDPYQEYTSEFTHYLTFPTRTNFRGIDIAIVDGHVRNQCLMMAAALLRNESLCPKDDTPPGILLHDSDQPYLHKNILAIKESVGTLTSLSVPEGWWDKAQSLAKDNKLFKDSELKLATSIIGHYMEKLPLYNRWEPEPEPTVNDTRAQME